jgi:chemotaxis protein histidine kinase CheA
MHHRHGGNSWTTSSRTTACASTSKICCLEPRPMDLSNYTTHRLAATKFRRYHKSKQQHRQSRHDASQAINNVARKIVHGKSTLDTASPDKICLCQVAAQSIATSMMSDNDSRIKSHHRRNLRSQQHALAALATPLLRHVAAVSLLPLLQLARRLAYLRRQAIGRR